MSVISGKTISSAPASFACREKSRTLRRFASGSPSEHEIWATAIFIHLLVETLISAACHVERSRDISELLSPFPITRDSSTPLGMTAVGFEESHFPVGNHSPSDRRLGCDRSTGPEKFSLFNEVRDFRWNHSLPVAVAGLQFDQHVVRMNSQILRMIVGNLLDVLIVD